MIEEKNTRIANYGSIVFKLDKVMKEKNLSKNKVAVGAGLNFRGLQGYYKGTISRIDCGVLARLCAVCNCTIEDIIEYKK